MDFKKLQLKTKKFVDTLFIWNYKTAFKWNWIEFSDFRQYEFWDDSKYIDFIASKREWKLLIKRFEEERQLNVFFILDLSSSMNFWIEKKKIQTLIETFYLLSFSASYNNDKVWALLFNDSGFSFIKPTKWKENLLKIIKTIEKNELNSIKEFGVNKLFSFFNSLPIKNSLVFVLTDKIWEIDEKYLKIQSIKNTLIYINIFDYIENNLENSDFSLKLWNEKNVSFINLRDTKKIEEYKKLRSDKIKAFWKNLSKYKIKYLLLDDKTNIYKEIFKLFKSI